MTKIRIECGTRNRIFYLDGSHKHLAVIRDALLCALSEISDRDHFDEEDYQEVLDAILAFEEKAGIKLEDFQNLLEKDYQGIIRRLQRGHPPILSMNGAKTIPHLREFDKKDDKKDYRLLTLRKKMEKP